MRTVAVSTRKPPAPFCWLAAVLGIDRMYVSCIDDDSAHGSRQHRSIERSGSHRAQPLCVAPNTFGQQAVRERERASRAGRYSRTNTSEQLANLLDVAKEQRFGNSQHQDVLRHRRAHQHQITGTLFDATIQCRRTGTKLASVFSQISRQRPSGVRPSNCTFGIVVCLITINTDTPDRERESVCMCVPPSES